MGDNPDELVRKAHSKLTPGFLGKMFSSKESRQEEAMDLLTSAANMYKINKNWKNPPLAVILYDLTRFLHGCLRRERHARPVASRCFFGECHPQPVFSPCPLTTTCKNT